MDAERRDFCQRLLVVALFFFNAFAHWMRNAKIEQSEDRDDCGEGHDSLPN